MTYIMSQGVRKFALTTHITVSVGWVGAVVAYLAVGLLADGDAQMMSAAILAMDLMMDWVIVPLALASLLTGLVMSLGTRWGLFRHYWVLYSFLLTVIAIIYLLTLGHTPTDAAGGLVVLFVINALNVYKPRGLTPYGWRKVQEQRTESQPSGGSN